MNRQNTLTWIAIWTCAALLAGCEASCTTAHFTSVKMARDPDGNQPTTVFAPGDTFYCLATMANVPSDTTVKFVWIGVETAGQPPNVKIKEAEATGSDNVYTANLSLPRPWPTGKYRVDLYIDGKLRNSADFTVAADE